MTVIRRIRRVALAAVAALLLTGAPARAAGPTDAAAVKITVLRVRASGVAEPGTKPEIDPALEKLQVTRLRRGEAKYALEETVEKSLAWGQALTLPVGAPGAAGGRYEVVPVEAGPAGKLVVRVEQQMPSAKEPCLKVSSEFDVRRTHLLFCDVAIDGGTILFFVTAELLAK